MRFWHIRCVCRLQKQKFNSHMLWCARSLLSYLSIPTSPFLFPPPPTPHPQVDTQSHGRNLPQIPNLFVEQIKRVLRKRHTLPYYKIRYKPFFAPQPSPTKRFEDLKQVERFLGTRCTFSRFLWLADSVSCFFSSLSSSLASSSFVFPR